MEKHNNTTDKDKKRLLKTEVASDKTGQNLAETKKIVKKPTGVSKPRKSESPDKNTVSKKLNAANRSHDVKKIAKIEKSTKETRIVDKTISKSTPKDTSTKLKESSKVPNHKTKTKPDITNSIKRKSLSKETKSVYPKADISIKKINNKSTEVKRKDKVLETHTNVTVQSPVHKKTTKENSFIKKDVENTKDDLIQINIKPEIVNPPLVKQFENDNEKPSTSSKHKRTKTRTLDTNEIKILKNISYTIDLSDPNAEISPENFDDVSKTEEYDYEDDFESYESDFESYNSSEPGEELSRISRQISNEENSNDDSKNSSLKDSMTTKAYNSEEERKLDSGNFELNPKQQFTIPVLTNINEHTDNSQKNEINITDEGFVEQINKNLVKQNHFIDFSQSKKNIKQRISKRGKEILEKLTLDAMTYHIFEMKPLTYNEYMNLYGNANCVQISSQTKDDNLSVEIQTEKILYANKWTQFPVSYAKYENSVQNSVYQTLCNGSDDQIQIQNSQKENPVDFYKLNKFLKYAASEMLLYLDEQLRPKMKHNKIEMKFSDGHYKLRQDGNLFKDMNGIFLDHSRKSNMILAVFSKNNNTKNNRMIKDMDESGDSIPIRQNKPESMVCIWHVQNSAEPRNILGVHANISCCTFTGIEDQIIVAGCKDGTIVCWDLTLDDNDINGLIKYPKQIIMDTEIDHGSITAIASMRQEFYEHDINSQVCILHQYGYLSIWTLIHSENNPKQDYGLSPYSKIRLIQSHIVEINPMKKKMDSIFDEHQNLFDKNVFGDIKMEFDKMCIDETDSRMVYVIQKDSNCIIGCSVNWADKFKYYIVDTDTPLCIATNQYKQPWFIVGCVNSIYLFKKLVSKPLMMIPIYQNNSVPFMSDKNYLKSVHFSTSQPNLIFLMTRTQISVLDLVKQELIYFCEVQESILDSVIYRKADRDYMVILFKNRVEVHKISKKYRLNSSGETTRHLEELTTFFRLY